MRKNQNGISLVEVAVGAMILVLVLTSAVLSLRVFSRTNSIAQNQDYVAQALNKGYEIIHAQAGRAADFDTMDSPPPETLMTDTPHFDKVKVYKIVGPVGFNGTRSREVTLTAYWREGDDAFIAGGDGHSNHKRTMTFIVSYINQKVGGATIKVHVESLTETGKGVQGVMVSAPSADGGTVGPMPTDSAGDAYLKGVFPNSAGVDVQFDSEQSYVSPNNFHRGYFFEAGNHGTDPSYSRVIKSPATQTAETAQIPTIKLSAPGKLRGRVVEWGTGTGIPNLPVVIEPKLGSLLINRSMSSTDKTVVTDSGGNFLFQGLVPNKPYKTTPPDCYFGFAAFIIGDGTWVGTANTGDAMDDHRENIHIDPGAEATVVLTTIKRGSVQGTAKSVAWNNATYYEVGPLTRSVTFYMDYIANQGYLNGTVNPLFDWQTTYVWNSAYRGWPIDRSFVTDNNGNYSRNYWLPWIVNKDRVDPNNFTSSYANPFDQQYQVIRLEAGNSMPSPLVPILVLGNLPTASANMVVTSEIGSMYTLIMPQTAVDANKGRVYPNVTRTWNPRFLERSAMANITGQVFKNDGATPFLESLEQSYVQVVWGDHGYGLMALDGASNAYMLRNNANRDTVDSDVPSVGRYFDMSNGSVRCLPPNLGADTTVLKYVGQTTRRSNTAPWYAEVQGYTQVLVGGDRVRQRVDFSTLAAEARTIKVGAWDSFGLLWWIDPQVIVPRTGGATATGQFTTANQNYHESDTYVGHTSQVSLQPGTDVTANITLDSDTPSVWPYPTWLGVYPSDYWTPPLNGFYFSKSGATYTGVIVLNKKLHTQDIYGKIFDASHPEVPISGLTIQLINIGAGSGGSDVVLAQQTTAASAWSNLGNTYQYHFSNNTFIFKDSSEDLAIMLFDAESKGYVTPAPIRLLGYDNISTERDFPLSVIPSAPVDTSL